MPRLKLIKYHPLFAYSIGDEFEVSKSDADILVKGNYAMPLSEKIETAEMKPKPENAAKNFKK